MVPAEAFPILLVEDSDDDLFLFKRVLTKAGIVNPLRVATNGQAAIDQLEAYLRTGSEADVPRIVFLDLKLPLRSGFEVLDWIRKEPRLRQTVVIVLSSSAELRDIKRAYELRANGYLVKYPAPAVFREIVQKISTLPDGVAPESLTFPGTPRPA